QAGELNDCLRADAQPRASGQPEKVDVARGDVLSQLAGSYGVALGTDLIQQLGMDQVHLPEIRLLAKLPDVIEVLVCRAGVRVALHSPILNQTDCVLWHLAERVSDSAVAGDNKAAYCFVSRQTRGDS